MQARVEFDALTAEFQATEEAVRAGAAPFDKAAAEPANKFRGVYPYPHNEVRTHCGHYVNASWMSARAIAAQYPTADYYARWWTALLHAGVTNILMLCQAGESLIHPLYYASRAFSSVEFCDADSGLCVLATTRSATWYAEEHVTRRSLHVQLYHVNTPTQRSNYYVEHLHYADWPDCAAPKDVRVLLLLKKQLLLCEGVCAVHCRAGIGRTGTFLAVLLYQEGESAQELVRRLRLLRPLLAHNFAQYQFIARFVQNKPQLEDGVQQQRSLCMAFYGYCAVLPLSVKLVQSGEHVGWKCTGRRVLLCVQDMKQLPSLISRLRPMFTASNSHTELERLRRRDWNGSCPIHHHHHHQERSA